MDASKPGTVWEVVLEGYDPAVATTDHLIKWARAATKSDVENFLRLFKYEWRSIEEMSPYAQKYEKEDGVDWDLTAAVDPE